MPEGMSESAAGRLASQIAGPPGPKPLGRRAGPPLPDLESAADLARTEPDHESFRCRGRAASAGGVPGALLGARRGAGHGGRPGVCAGDRRGSRRRRRPDRGSRVRPAARRAARTGGGSPGPAVPSTRSPPIGSRPSGGRCEPPGTPVFAPGSYHWPTFLTARNLLNVVNQNADIAIIALGMTLVILTAGIDLSVGSLLALAGVIAAVTAQEWFGGAAASPAGLLAAMLLGVAAAALGGLLSGTMGHRVPGAAVRGHAGSDDAGARSGADPGRRSPAAPGGRGRGGYAGGGAGRRGRLRMARQRRRAGRAESDPAHARPVRRRSPADDPHHVRTLRLRRRRQRRGGAPVRRAGDRGCCSPSTACAGRSPAWRASSTPPASRADGPMPASSTNCRSSPPSWSAARALAGGRGRIAGTLIGAMIIAVIQNGLNIAGVASYEQKVVFGAPDPRCRSA